jgi:uncharacterized protein (TIGR00251 family)
MTMPWLRRETCGDLLLILHVQPGAKKTGIAGTHGEALKIRLASPPVDGKANDCLIEFLSELLDVPRARVELVSGAASRQKRVRIGGVRQEAVERLLVAEK